MFLYFLFGCNDSVHAQINVVIDYQNVNEIEIEKLKEIAESEDYLPGRLKDLFVASDGTMLVSDISSTTIEQFNAEGEHMGTIASEGNGPGELPFFFSLSDGGNDTLIVQDNTSTQLDFFGRESNGIYSYVRSSITEPGSNYQPISIAGAHGESTYYAIRNLTEVALGLPNYRMDELIIIDGLQEVQYESSHTLKTANTLLADPRDYSTHVTFGGLTPVGMPPYSYEDRFSVLENGRYLIARPDSSAIYFYNHTHECTGQISLNVKPHTVVEKHDLDYKLRGQSRQARRMLEQQVASLKPPFLNVWVNNHHILLHTDSNSQGKEMVVLTMEGEAVGRFYLSEFDDIRYFIDNRIYTLYHDPYGHTIRIYQIELE
ncbi:MAG: hypothetical protein JJU13_11905 [Balneolaceae bacterium]|nr:hypothetical protein [Balneolaceae bacterium]